MKEWAKNTFRIAPMVGMLYFVLVFMFIFFLPTALISGGAENGLFLLIVFSLMALTFYWMGVISNLLGRSERTKFDTALGVTFIVMFLCGLSISLPTAERFGITAGLITEAVVACTTFAIVFALQYIQLPPLPEEA